MKAVITVSRMTASIIAIAAAGMFVSIAPLPAPPVSYGQTTAPVGIASSASVGAPTIAAGAIVVAPASIASTAIASAPTVQPGAKNVTVPSTASSASVGVPAVAVGAASVSPPSIIRTSACGVPAVSTGAVALAPAGIASTSTVTTPAIAAGPVTLAVAGIPPTSSLGTASLSNPGPTYDADAAAAFAAMTVQPTANRKTLYNNLIVGLKADGVWAKLDWLAILAAETAQAGRLNLKNPAKSWSTINSPVFTADRGYQGDGTSAHLDMGEPFGFSGALYVQNDAHIMVAANDGGSTTTRSPHIGNVGTARSAINVLGVAGNNTYQINASVGTAYVGSAVASGIRMATRASSASSSAYTNGSVMDSSASTSGTLSTTNGALLRSQSTYSDDRVSAAGSGSSLTAADVTAYYNRLNTFLSAIGAI